MNTVFTSLSLVLAIALACTLSACGQEGPLYLPGTPPPIKVPPPPPPTLEELPS